MVRPSVFRTTSAGMNYDEKAVGAEQSVKPIINALDAALK